MTTFMNKNSHFVESELYIFSPSFSLKTSLVKSYFIRTLHVTKM